MNRTALTLAALLAMLAKPAFAAPLPPGESCPTLAQSVEDAKAMAAAHHGGVLFLDGDQAHRFLASIAPPGSAIKLAADHVAVFIDPAANASFIMPADSRCGGYGSSVRIELFALSAALAAAQR